MQGTYVTATFVKGEVQGGCSTALVQPRELEFTAGVTAT